MYFKLVLISSLFIVAFAADGNFYDTFWPELNDTLMTFELNSSLIINTTTHILIPSETTTHPKGLSAISNKKIFFMPHELNKSIIAIRIVNCSISNVESSHFRGLKLQVLDLSGNKLIKLAPTALSEQVTLTHLALSETHLSSPDKNLFSSLTNLRNLKIASNGMKKLDKELLGHLTMLTHLNIADNKIEVLNGDELKNNTNLIMIELNNNPIKKLNVTLFEKKSNLLFVGLSGCIDGNFTKGPLPFNLPFNFDAMKKTILSKCSGANGAGNIKVGLVSILLVLISIVMIKF